MASFFTTTVGITVLVWALFVITIVVITYTENSGKRYAPGPSLCPDRWSRLADGSCQVDPSNQGSLPNGFTSTFTGTDWVGTARKKWAQLHKIRWDGL